MRKDLIKKNRQQRSCNKESHRKRNKVEITINIVQLSIHQTRNLSKMSRWALLAKINVQI